MSKFIIISADNIRSEHSVSFIDMCETLKNNYEEYAMFAQSKKITYEVNIPFTNDNIIRFLACATGPNISNINECIELIKMAKWLDYSIRPPLYNNVIAFLYNYFNDDEKTQQYLDLNNKINIAWISGRIEKIVYNNISLGELKRMTNFMVWYRARYDTATWDDLLKMIDKQKNKDILEQYKKDFNDLYINCTKYKNKIVNF